MKTAKEISIISVFTALLIGGQLALSAVSGIEIVTALTVSFFYKFSVKRSLIVATAFSLLRCFIFGFFPNVVILYLIYYNLLAVIFGSLGKAFNKKVEIKSIIVVTITAVLCTALFTVIDNVISLIYFGLSKNAFIIYYKASLLTMIPQLICVGISVPITFYPLVKIYEKINV